MMLFHCCRLYFLLSVTHVYNPLSASSTKWLNTLKQFTENLPTNCLSVFDHFVELVLKGLNSREYYRIFAFRKCEYIWSHLIWSHLPWTYFSPYKHR